MVRGPDPPWTGRFTFEVDGITIGAFTEVSGLAMEVDVQPIKEGGQNGFEHKMPGRTKWQNLVLKRGVTNNNALFEWIDKVSGETSNYRLQRVNGTLRAVDWQGAPLRSWDFYDAFPVKWSGPSFSAKSSEVAIEELEIAHHGIRAS